MSAGLISYGVDRIEQQRGAAGYVDRILKVQNLLNFRFRLRRDTNW